TKEVIQLLGRLREDTLRMLLHKKSLDVRRRLLHTTILRVRARLISALEVSREAIDFSEGILLAVWTENGHESSLLSYVLSDLARKRRASLRSISRRAASCSSDSEGSSIRRSSPPADAVRTSAA